MSILELFEDFDVDCIGVEDCDIVVQGNLITHLTKDDNNKVHIWCGDPQNDKYAEELILPTAKRKKIFAQVIEEVG